MREMPVDLRRRVRVEGLGEEFLRELRQFQHGWNGIKTQDFTAIDAVVEIAFAQRCCGCAVHHGVRC